MVTIKDIAKEAKVSVTTVSNVIHNRTTRVSKKTIKKVQLILDKYNYIPNMSARSLVNNNSMLIGVLFFKSDNGGSNLFEDPFNTELLSGIDEVSKAHGYYILVRSVSSVDEIRLICNTWQISGIIVLGLLDNKLNKLTEVSHIPIVFVDTYINNSSMNHLSVGINDLEGAKIATEHLIENGHKKIGFVSYKMILGGVIEQRYFGYSETLSQYKLQKNHNINFQYMDGSESIENFCDSIVSKRNDITGLVFTADNLAIEVMYQLKEKGINIPEDISIVGFDNIPASKIINPGLTSIDQDIRLKGRKAVLMLIESINTCVNKSKKIEIPIKLIKRQSVKRIK